MLNQIRTVLHDICLHLTSDDLERLKFLTTDKFGEGVLEKIKTAFDFVELVMKDSSSDKQCTLYMVELLTGIMRKDLVTKLKKCLLGLVATLEGPVSSYLCRQELHSQVTEIIYSNQNAKIIAFIGMVGIGKTEMMKWICLKLQGKNTVIQPTEGSASTKFSDILHSIHDILKYISYDVKPEKSSIIACLEELASPFVLSLDIAKVPHTSKFCSNIKKFINEVQSISHCKLILTSARYSCKGCQKKNDKTMSIIMPPFNFQESFSALGKQRSNWDAILIVDVINDCQGIPIHLENIIDDEQGSLVRQSFHIDTSKFVADEAFITYINTCGSQIKKSLVYLCHIKDEFPLELAAVILEIEIQDAMNICSVLQKEQLLLQRGRRYHMPWIVQYYIIDMINTRKDLHKEAKMAKCSLIKLLVGFLYQLNEFFMGYHYASECNLFDELLNEADPKLCTTDPAVQAIEFYKRYKRSFNWALKEGISDESLKLAEAVADCANECVSFLAKAMEKSAVIHLYQKVRNCNRIMRNDIRNACTLVSIAFLKMYHNGCDSDANQIEKMLRSALDCLCNVDNFESSSQHFHMKEVIAHCYSKLGHMAAKLPDSFDIGRKMIHEAIKIREQEVKRNLGSRALVAAGYVDIAKIYGHHKKYEEAKENYEKALGIYQKELGKHPFVATTMCCLAETYWKLGDEQKSSELSFKAKELSSCILGEHLDTARVLAQHAKAVAKEDKDRAIHLYKYAQEIGEHRMRKKESIDMLNECIQLCDEKEAACLKKKIEKTRRGICVEWREPIPVDDFRPRSVNGKAFYNREFWFLPLIALAILAFLTLLSLFYKDGNSCR